MFEIGAEMLDTVGVQLSRARLGNHRPRPVDGALRETGGGMLRQSPMQLLQQAVSSDFATRSSAETGRLFLEGMGERNHGFADLRVSKRGESYQNSLNIAPPQNETVDAQHFHTARVRARQCVVRLHSVD